MAASGANAPQAQTDTAGVGIGLYALVGRPLPPPAAPVVLHEGEAVTLAASVLERYAGRYRLTPQTDVILTVEDGRIFGALSGRPKVELFAESPTRFFARAMDAQIEIRLAPDGSVAGLLLRINGQEMSASRVPEN